MATWTNVNKNPSEFDTQYLIIGDTYNLVIGDGFVLKIQSAGEIWSGIGKNTATWTNVTKN